MVRGSIIEGSGGSRFGNFRFVPSLVVVVQCGMKLSCLCPAMLCLLLMPCMYSIKGIESNLEAVSLLFCVKNKIAKEIHSIKSRTVLL